MSSSIPSLQISTAHAQPFRGARDLIFCLKVPLDSLLVWASSEGSGETARMRRLAWTFAARIGDKYQIRLTRSICIHQKIFLQSWVLGKLNQLKGKTQTDYSSLYIHSEQISFTPFILLTIHQSLTPPAIFNQVVTASWTLWFHYQLAI